MRILFVHGNVYAVGGIETWLTRMVSRLDLDGHDVALLTRPRGEPWDETSAIIDHLSEHASIHLGSRHWFRTPPPQPPLEPADVLFASNVPALLVAALVQQHLMPEAKIVAGVFHPREYCSKAPLRQRRWRQHVTERLVQRLPIENFLFSTGGMARQTGQCLGRDLSRAPVLPIPVDTERLRPVRNRRIDRSKIVSVTRLVPMYFSHHHQMIRVIRELRDQGHGFTYHAYGEGEMRGALEAQARHLGVEDAVFFHGTVPYDEFPEAIGDAFLYIGLGTALLEAAACGLPALVAIDSQPGTETFGFIQDMVGHEAGGHAPGHPRYQLSERVLWLAGRTEEEYRQVEEDSRTRAEEFSLTRLVPRLVEVLRGAAPFSAPISLASRMFGQVDWLLEAVLLNLGAPDRWSERYTSPLSAEESSAMRGETPG